MLLCWAPQDSVGKWGSLAWQKEQCLSRLDGLRFKLIAATLVT